MTAIDLPTAHLRAGTQFDIFDWFATTILPRSSAEGTYEKLQEELAEFKEAYENFWQASTYLGDDADEEEQRVIQAAWDKLREEAADVAIVFLCWALAANIGLGDQVAKKHVVNKARTWGEPDGRGVIRHT